MTKNSNAQFITRSPRIGYVILDEIVKKKRREVAARKAATPLAGLEKMIASMPPARDFKAALDVDAGCAIIAEVKRRSPSRGLLRADFDPVRIAREYEHCGVAAVSVLTDETFFGGCNADLAAVKSAVSLPVLRKEFIIDPYQVCETREIGADAILLIAAILTEGQLREYRELAESLGLAAWSRSTTGRIWRRPSPPARRSSGSTTGT